MYVSSAFLGANPALQHLHLQRWGSWESDWMAFAELTGSNLYNLSAEVFFFFKGLGKRLHCTAAERQDRKDENHSGRISGR